MIRTRSITAVHIHFWLVSQVTITRVPDISNTGPHVPALMAWKSRSTPKSAAACRRNANNEVMGTDELAIGI